MMIKQPGIVIIKYLCSEEIRCLFLFFPISLSELNLIEVPETKIEHGIYPHHYSQNKRNLFKQQDQNQDTLRCPFISQEKGGVEVQRERNSPLASRT